MQRLLEAYKTLSGLTASGETTVDVKELRNKCYDAMNDDMNTAQVISHLFDASRAINQLADKKATDQDIVNVVRATRTLRMFCDEIIAEMEEMDRQEDEARKGG